LERLRSGNRGRADHLDNPAPPHLFAEVGQWRVGWFTVPWPDVLSLRLDTFLLSLLAALLLFRCHLGVVKTVAAMAVAGLVLMLARSA
jgi:hypothetical protein